MTTNPSILLNTTMSLITIEQFDEFVELNPEMEQFYDFRYDSEPKDADDDEELFNPFLPADQLEDYYSCRDGIDYED